MSHDKLFGICENKCLVETMSKAAIEESFTEVESAKFDKSKIKVKNVESISIPARSSASFSFNELDDNGIIIGVNATININGQIRKFFDLNSLGVYFEIACQKIDNGEKKFTIYNQLSNSGTMQMTIYYINDFS